MYLTTDLETCLICFLCCNVLQCVAVCCSVIQCVAVCCSVLLLMAMFCRLQCDTELQRVAVCCSVLQFATVSCSVLKCVAVCCSVTKFDVTLWNIHPKDMSTQFGNVHTLSCALPFGRWSMCSCVCVCVCVCV